MASSLERVAPDVHFLVFPTTDGDASRRPENTRPPPLSAREVNWHRPMTVDERFACRWRNLIGQGIAKMLEKPYMEKYCLQGFPDGYNMFDHNKGHLTNIRHDLYLYGSKTVLRFRSPAEFIPHGYWLLTDRMLNPKNCGCKYCGGGRSQTTISSTLGLPTNRGPRSMPSSSRMRVGVRPIPRSGRGLPPVPATPSSWVHPALRHDPTTAPVWQTTSLGHQLAATPIRISDLRAGRRFRVGELIWCASSPDDGRARTRWRDIIGDVVPFWPALVLDFSLAAVVRHTGSSEGAPYSVQQKRQYTVLRLGAPSEDGYGEFEDTVDEDEILPWQAYSADVCHVSCDKPDPLTSALQIAQHVANVWALCGTLSIQISSSQHADNATPTPTPPEPNTVTEMRYEGLWYGAERIWVGDVVRLCPEREAFDASLRVSCDESLAATAPVDAPIHSVLIRLDRVYVRLGKSGTKECVIAGPLYELAPADLTIDATATLERRRSKKSDKVIAPWDVSHASPSGETSDRSTALSDQSSFPLPSPPPGYTLRPLLRPGFELVLPAALIAGRYYPDILEWPLLAKMLDDKDPCALDLQAMCGLVAGRFNHAVCEYVRVDNRAHILREATRNVHC